MPAISAHAPPLHGFGVRYDLPIVWYLQVVLIVLGHVIAVYLAHLRAGERFRTAQRALLKPLDPRPAHHPRRVMGYPSGSEPS